MLRIGLLAAFARCSPVVVSTVGEITEGGAQGHGAGGTPRGRPGRLHGGSEGGAELIRVVATGEGLNDESDQLTERGAVLTGRGRKVIVAMAAVVLAAVIGGVLLLQHGSPGGTAHKTVSAKSSTQTGLAPPQAAAAAQLLVSASGRTVLTPELNASLQPGRMFPAGTTFTVQRESWHQAGAYANVSGILRIPGYPPELAEVGLVHRSGRWLITFEASK